LLEGRPVLGGNFFVSSINEMTHLPKIQGVSGEGEFVKIAECRGRSATHKLAIQALQIIRSVIHIKCQCSAVQDLAIWCRSALMMGPVGEDCIS